MTEREAIMLWLEARGIEPSRTPEDFLADANGIIGALEKAGFAIVKHQKEQGR